MPAIDRFKNHANSLESPLGHARQIVPSDTGDLDVVTRALHVGTGGTLRVTMAGGEVVSFVDLGAGWHPLRVARVHATGTTALDIVGAW